MKRREDPERALGHAFRAEPREISNGQHDPDSWVTNRTINDEYPIPPNVVRSGGIDGEEILILGWKNRVRHFTWTWFCLTMATGGIANVIHSVQPRFTGLFAIGVLFFILALAFFICSCIAMGLRFYHHTETFRMSFLHPTESLFVPAAIIALATILIDICSYGLSPGKTGEWLIVTMTVFYWIYIALAIAFSVGIYLLMWSTQMFTISQMTPVWIFPAYPLLLVGPFAGVLAEKQLPRHTNDAVQIIVGGVIIQGIGFMVSLMIYSAYLYRLMTQKLPAESTRPGMFISVGPSGFTVSGLINMGTIIPKAVPANFMGNGELSGQVAKIIAYWSGFWLWGLAIWFFFISIGAHWSCVSGHRMHFAMTWYAFVFPNTALITATFSVAKALGGNYPIEITGCVMTCILIVVWAFLIGMNLRAIALKQILWPQRQEDSDAHFMKKEFTRHQKQELGFAIEARIDEQGADGMDLEPESRASEPVHKPRANEPKRRVQK